MFGAIGIALGITIQCSGCIARVEKSKMTKDQNGNYLCSDCMKRSQ